MCSASGPGASPVPWQHGRMLCHRPGWDCPPPRRLPFLFPPSALPLSQVHTLLLPRVPLLLVSGPVSAGGHVAEFGSWSCDLIPRELTVLWAQVTRANFQLEKERTWCFPPHFRGETQFCFSDQSPLWRPGCPQDGPQGIGSPSLLKTSLGFTFLCCLF